MEDIRATGKRKRRVAQKKNADQMKQAQEHICLSHDIIEEILLRLPLKSLAKFRAVVTHRSFISKSYPVFKPMLTRSRVGFHGEVIDEFTIDGLPYGNHHLSNFVNGFTCLYGGDDSYLLNLETKESVMLPSVREQNSTAATNIHYGKCPTMSLGFSTNTGQYKVVMNLHDIELRTDVWEILTFGNKEWRSIEQPYDLLRGKSRFACIEGKPVLLHGVLHWIVTPPSPPGVLSLDMNEETFEFRPAPASPWGNELLELHGQLCFLGLSREKGLVEIWRLKDYANQVRSLWMKEFTIDLRAMELVEPVHISVVGSQSGKIVFKSWGQCVICYDTREKAFTRPNFELRDVIDMYTESLVSPKNLIR